MGVADGGGHRLLKHRGDRREGRMEMVRHVRIGLMWFKRDFKHHAEIWAVTIIMMVHPLPVVPQAQSNPPKHRHSFGGQSHHTGSNAALCGYLHLSCLQ